mgnify:CR=1 FL=1
METKLFYAVLVAVVFAVSGCGGGGGASAPSTPPVALAVVIIDATKSVPSSDGSFVPVGVKPSVTWTITGGTYSSNAYTLTCGTSAVTGAITVSGNTATFALAANLPYASVCKEKWTVTAVNSAGAATTATQERTFNTEPQPPVPPVLVCTTPQVADSAGTKCVDPVVAWWPPKTIESKVTAYYQLPAGCDSISTDGGRTPTGCFRDAIKDGMPAVSGGLGASRDTGPDGVVDAPTPLVWLGFISPTGNWYVAPFYASNGTWAGLLIHGNPYNAGTAMWTATDGVITRDTTTCNKTIYVEAGYDAIGGKLYWKTDPVACPQ